MKILNKLFGKKKETKEVKDPVVEQPVLTGENSVICTFCNKEIFQHDQRKKLGKNRFHRKCYKKVVKMADQQRKGNLNVEISKFR